jgi:PEGA domain
MVMTPILKYSGDSKHCQQAPQGQPARKLLRSAVEFALLLTLAASCAFAQAAAEYGSATSSMATSSTAGANLMNSVKFPDTSQSNATVIMSQPSKDSKGSPNYILDSMKHGSVAANRKALEAEAGKNAAKLMLRSTPTGAYVKINGKPVGKTPILLVVPPGRYDVAMDGKRMEHAEQGVDLLPKETREFSLALKQLYPTEVMIHLH